MTKDLNKPLAKRRKKGQAMLLALEILENSAATLGDLFYAFTLPYGTTLGQALRKLEKRQSQRGQWAQRVTANLVESRRLRALLHRLYRDGLVEGSAKTQYHISEKGKQMLAKLRHRQAGGLSIPEYSVYPSNIWHIIIFDIPEIERQKRSWLRQVLTKLGFTMIQKSVWLGKVKVPESFIRDISTLGMADYIHIFAVNKSGSLSDFL